jgi:hypothetical protein
LMPSIRRQPSVESGMVAAKDEPMAKGKANSHQPG